MATISAIEGIDRLFDDLARAETRLYNALGDRLSGEHGLAMSQFELLRFLQRHPGSRVADVAANFAAGIGAISKGVDRLVARGWVARRSNPADGRSSLLSLTKAGSELVVAGEGTYREGLAELVSPALTPDQVAAAGAALALLRAALENDRIGLPVG